MKAGPWRLIFLGTPGFAVPSLEALLAAGEEVPAVITQPDRPRGRGRKISFSPIKELALSRGLKVLQPERLKDPDLLAQLAAMQPELLVVVAYGRILTPEFLALPSKDCVNVHASLLPRHRGSAPINWALIRGDTETGVTTMSMAPEVDSGPIYLQEPVPILPEDNAGTLAAQLAQRGAALLVKTLELMRQGKAVANVQPEEGVTMAPPIAAEMRLLNWTLQAPEVAGWIRGLDPAPGAYTFYRGRMLRLFGARVHRQQESLSTPGTVLALTPQGLEISCGRGSITVQDLQLAGHKRLGAPEFLRGRPLLSEILGK